MSWVRVDDKFPWHPKVLGLSAQAAALWLAAVCWSSSSETDGLLPAAGVAQLRWYTERAAAELVRAGLWKECDGGWQIHDFLSFNPSKQQREEKRSAWRERQAQHRAKSKDTSPVTHHVTRDSRVSQGNGEGEKIDLFNLGGSAEGVRSEPAPAPDAAAARVLDALNAGRKRVVSGARILRPTETNLKLIGERLREGHSLEDCEHVIAVYEADVGADASKARWFNHETPFRPENFARALGRTPQPPSSPQRPQVRGTQNRPTWKAPT